MAYSMTQEEAQGLAEEASALPRVQASAVQGAKQRGGYCILVKHTRERLQTRVYTKEQLASILEAWAQFDEGETTNATTATQLGPAYRKRPGEHRLDPVAQSGYQVL